MLFPSVRPPAPLDPGRLQVKLSILINPFGVIVVRRYVNDFENSRFVEIKNLVTLSAIYSRSIPCATSKIPSVPFS